MGWQTLQGTAAENSAQHISIYQNSLLTLPYFLPMNGLPTEKEFLLNHLELTPLQSLSQALKMVLGILAAI